LSNLLASQSQNGNASNLQIIKIKAKIENNNPGVKKVLVGHTNHLTTYGRTTKGKFPARLSIM